MSIDFFNQRKERAKIRCGTMLVLERTRTSTRVALVPKTSVSTIPPLRQRRIDTKAWEPHAHRYRDNPLNLKQRAHRTCAPLTSSGL